MKKTLIYSVIALVTGALSMACQKDDPIYDPGIYTPNAIVTLKTDAADGTFYMQLDDKTTLLPVNVKESPYKQKEIRAFVNYKETEDDAGKYSKAVYCHWIDSVRTKSMAPYLSSVEENRREYGVDPINLTGEFPTVVEDGYLTVVFATRFYGGIKHEINLVKGDKPNEVYIYHDAKGDLNGYMQRGIISFRLDDLDLPEGEETDLVVRWMSYNGERQTTFKYLPRNFGKN